MKRLVVLVALASMTLSAAADVIVPGHPRRSGGGPPRPVPVVKKEEPKKRVAAPSDTAATTTTATTETTTATTATTATVAEKPIAKEPAKPVNAAAVPATPQSNAWPLISLSALGLVAIALILARRRREQ